MSDDFTERVKKVLAGRVGWLCSNPECRALTTGPQEDPAKVVNLGVAAHITAASPGGPRYDPVISPEQRSAPTNGIWLCQKCAKLIDSDVARFAVDILTKWKSDAELEAKARMGKSAELWTSLSDVFVDISVMNEDTSWTRGIETILRYDIARPEDRITIEPNLGYQRLFSKGGPIEELEYVMSPAYCPFKWRFPILDFKVLNTRQTPAFLTEIVFDVQESYVDRNPLFAIKRDSQQRFAGELRLVNEGWCDLVDLDVSFLLLPGKVAPVEIAAPYPHSIRLPILRDHAELDIVDAFRREGVDIDGLIALSNAEETLADAERQATRQRCLGRFAEEVGTLAGEISFAASHSADRHKVKFHAAVYLADANRMGILRPPTYRYDTAFEAEGLNYQRRVQISHTLQPGEADRFTVEIAVAQSSGHRFRATLRDITGWTLQSLPIEMNAFVPRSRSTSVGNALSRSKTG